MHPRPKAEITRPLPRCLRSTEVFLLALVTLTACKDEHLSPSNASASPRVASAAIASENAPNVIVIMTDDQTVEEMRVLSQTQSLLGSAGVTFDKSVVTYALCCPSRATFLTGQYPHNHGVRGNALPDGGYSRLDHSNTLPVWLQNRGYVTGHIGKYLNGYGLADPLEIPPGWTEWYASSDESAYRYFTYSVNQNGTLVPYGSQAAEYRTDVQTDQAVDFIRRRAPDARAGITPFFLFVGYLAPHWGRPIEAGDPLISTPVPAPRHNGRFAGVLLPRSPAFNERDVSDKPLSIRSQPLLTATQTTELGVAYQQRLESLLAVDEGVARIIATLEEQGLLQNTVVLFTSDNGWFQGEHRIGFGKVTPYEAGVKVPLLIRGPGITPGRHIQAPVANIDLAPTIVELTGATAGRTMDGLSLGRFLSGGQTAWNIGTQRHILVEDAPSGRASTVFWSIRRGVYVYTEYANGDRELYNLQADSAQLRSRHADPELANLRRQLATKLAAMKSCVGPSACW